jgi:DNA ligase-4
VRDINAMLDTLAQERDKGSPARAAVFRRAVTELSASENMWFARIILKDLKMGMKHESMLKLFDPQALDIYNACSSLEQVCTQVARPGRGHQAAFALVDYFLPCKPMLASSPPWEQVVTKMRGHPFFVEPKYDGERILIHKKGDQVKLFTRKSIEYTHRYSYGTTFAPVVKLALPNHDCIIDGEMLTYDSATGQFLKFGSNRTIALAGAGAAEDSSKQLCYVAFDILKLDDTVLLDKPLRQRRELLQRLVQAQPKRFEVISHRTDINSSQGLLTGLNDALAQGMEGVIVKDATTPYVLNDRSDSWIKVKPDYIDGLRDDMDLILLGAYYGEGTRRSGDVSHFLLGLLERKPDASEFAKLSDRNRLPPRVFTFCKVGSGYSLERLRSLRRELETKWVKYDPNRQPPHFMGWKHERSDIPDVWIDPRDAPCFQIKCYEITACRPNKFSAG